ncbi:MAG TPA: hypothetical protein VFM18_08415, partial [Methanosarcina sp.]|nr:hypothetical protein [Methanosarcina sp.]
SWQGPYEENNVYLGYAYSSDGENWEKYGQVINRSAEDPYVVKYNGTYYLFAEDKEEVPFKGIMRYHSTDFIHWVYDGHILDPQSEGRIPGWENTDVSSPIVWIENNTWYLLYEGRGYAPGVDNGGMGGLATSSNGLTWTRDAANPVFEWGAPGTFDANETIGDDIAKINGTYYYAYHAYNLTNGIYHEGIGIATSTDLHNWTHPTQPLTTNTDTLMYMYDGNWSFIFMPFDSENGIHLYYPTTSYNSTNWPYSDLSPMLRGITDQSLVTISNTDGVLHLASQPSTDSSVNILFNKTFTNNIAIEMKRKTTPVYKSAYSSLSLGGGNPLEADGMAGHWHDTALASGYSWSTAPSNTGQLYKNPVSGEYVTLGTSFPLS